MKRRVTHRLCLPHAQQHVQRNMQGDARLQSHASPGWCSAACALRHAAVGVCTADDSERPWPDGHRRFFDAGAGLRLPRVFAYPPSSSSHALTGSQCVTAAAANDPPVAWYAPVQAAPSTPAHPRPGAWVGQGPALTCRTQAPQQPGAAQARAAGRPTRPAQTHKQRSLLWTCRMKVRQ